MTARLTWVTEIVFALSFLQLIYFTGGISKLYMLLEATNTFRDSRVLYRKDLDFYLAQYCYFYSIP